MSLVCWRRTENRKVILKFIDIQLSLVRCSRARNSGLSLLAYVETTYLVHHVKKVVYRANKLRPTVTPAATGLLMLTSLRWKMHGEWKSEIKIHWYLIVIASTEPTMYLHRIFVVSLFIMALLNCPGPLLTFDLLGFGFPWPMFFVARSVWIAQAGRQLVRRYDQINKARHGSRDRRQP